jgi:hypothetical protein
MPDHLAVTLALLASCVVALTLAAVGAATLDFLLGKLHQAGDLADAILAFFLVAPSIAVLGVVSCFAVLMNWHRAISWRAPTFAFTLGVILVWVWGHDWIGITPVVPGAIAWLVICWLSGRKVSAHTEHVVKA